MSDYSNSVDGLGLHAECLRHRFLDDAITDSHLQILVIRSDFAQQEVADVDEIGGLVKH